jgi:hypothetical protein
VEKNQEIKIVKGHFTVFAGMKMQALLRSIKVFLTLTYAMRGSMKNLGNFNAAFSEKTIKRSGMKGGNKRSKNGLINLVEYYQNVFDRYENIHYYSSKDYQNAKRSFVKYSLKKRKFLA